jgi:hypothetical protein
VTEVNGEMMCAQYIYFREPTHEAQAGEPNWMWAARLKLFQLVTLVQPVVMNLRKATNGFGGIKAERHVKVVPIIRT